MLPCQDSNRNYFFQREMCYHYTTRDSKLVRSQGVEPCMLLSQSKVLTATLPPDKKDPPELRITIQRGAADLLKKTLREMAYK